MNRKHKQINIIHFRAGASANILNDRETYTHHDHRQNNFHRRLNQITQSCEILYNGRKIINKLVYRPQDCSEQSRTVAVRSSGNIDMVEQLKWMQCENR